MNPITSLLLSLAGCMVLFYMQGVRVTIIFETLEQRRDAIYFCVIVCAMLGVLAIWLGSV